jgi:hypothetical protein
MIEITTKTIIKLLILMSFVNLCQTSDILAYNFSLNFIVNKNYAKDYANPSNANYKSLKTNLQVYVIYFYHMNLNN